MFVAIRFFLAASMVLLRCISITGQFSSPYKMTFASADPVAAQSFCVKYFGAQPISQPYKGGDGECAMLKWLKFHQEGEHLIDYQFHFVKAYNYPNGSMTLDQFENRMASLHGNFSSFDSFMDFHATLATDDLDPFASALIVDRKPLLVRQFNGNFSLFVEIPHGIVLEIVSSKLTVLKPQTWNRCGAPQRPAEIDYLAIATRKWKPAHSTPSLRPLRAVYASTAPANDAQFVATYFEGQYSAKPISAKQALGPGYGNCYEVHGVHWSNNNLNYSPSGFREYDMWWIFSPHVRRGDYTVKEYEGYLHALHGNISGHYDEYMDNHVALFWQDGDSVIKRLQDDNVPFKLVGQNYANHTVQGLDIFIESPNGQVYEIAAFHQTLFNTSTIPSWDLCSHRPTAEQPSVALV